MANWDQPSASPDHAITGANSNVRQSGTTLANIPKIGSCRQSPAKRGWGGARNSALRTSTHLSHRQCIDLMAAGDFADMIGLRFNRHWTVHYERAGIAEHDGARFIGRLLKQAGDYARRHGGRLAAIWVREGGEGKGGHVHILMYLPSHLSLRGKTRRWIGLAGGECHAGVSVVKPIAGRVAAADGDSAHYRHNVSVVRRYILKNVADDDGERLGLSLKGHSGLVIGKRCGWTQSIGSAERERYV